MNRTIASGLIVFILGLLYYRAAGSLSQGMLSDPIGASGFPKLLASLLMALSLILVVQGAVSLVRGKPPAGAGDEGEKEKRALPQATVMFLMGITYILAVSWAGYLLSIALLVFCVAYFLRAPLTWRLPLISAGCGIVLWGFFVYAMKIKMPGGIWMRILP